jgi:hypothetical protein
MGSRLATSVLLGTDIFPLASEKYTKRYRQANVLGRAWTCLEVLIFTLILTSHSSLSITIFASASPLSRESCISFTALSFLFSPLAPLLSPLASCLLPLPRLFAQVSNLLPFCSSFPLLTSLASRLPPVAPHSSPRVPRAYSIVHCPSRAIAVALLASLLRIDLRLIGHRLTYCSYKCFLSCLLILWYLTSHICALVSPTALPFTHLMSIASRLTLPSSLSCHIF